LIECSREAIEDIAEARIRLPEAVGDHLVDEVIGDQYPLIDERLRRPAKLSSILDVGAEDVPGGYLRDSIESHQCLRLGSLSNSGSA